MDNINYEAPRIEVLEVIVEKGFSSSNVFGEDEDTLTPPTH